MRTRKSEIDKLIQLLETLREPRRKYHIMCIMQTNQTGITKYLNLGFKYGLISRDTRHYFINNKGATLLSMLSDIQ